MTRIWKWLTIAAVGGPIAVLGGMLSFGTSGAPGPLQSIASPFKSVDFSDLPPLQMLAVLPASPIAYRRYGAPKARDVVIALHGSTGSSSSLHVLANALAAADMVVYAPDLRGHGATGSRGDVDYLGQPDDDMQKFASFVKAAHPMARISLIGFSLGGGFALRTAGGGNSGLFDRTFLLAPALGGQAPTMKRGDDPWARPHILRIIALTILNRIGIAAFNGLEAIAYAVPPGSEKAQTGSYSYRLLYSLLPRDYGAALKAASKPLSVIVGERDELFDFKQFEPAVRPYRPDVLITVVPGIDHIHLTLDPAALAVLVEALR